MSKAAIDSIPHETLVTLTVDDILNLADRLLSRGISTLSTTTRRERSDLVLASRALRELIFAYERNTGRELHAIFVIAGHQ